MGNKASHTSTTIRAQRAVSTINVAQPYIQPIVDVDPDAIDNFAFKGRHIVQVAGVQDGDTVSFILRLNDFPLKLNLRLAGIDTPELRGKTENEKYRAHQARMRLIELLQWHPYSPGMGTWAEVDLQNWDKYGGRVVGHIYVKYHGETQSCSDILVHEKLARPYDGKTHKEAW